MDRPRQDLITALLWMAMQFTLSTLSIAINGGEDGAYKYNNHRYGLTYYTEVVSEALRLTGAKVYTTPVHSLVVTFDILQSKPMTDIPRISLKAVIQALLILFSSTFLTHLYF